jgi:ABC-type bacteriocin/lantibiotic exporter with double-glycine peptidase domain
LTLSLTQAFLLGIGAWKVMQGQMTIGMLMALQVLLSGFLMPVMQFVNFGALIQRLKVNVSRLDDVLKNPIDEANYQRPSADSSATVRVAGYLEFQNVTFGYSPLSEPLLRNFSFTLKPGQRIALVGATGCGKSTIARLACHLYQPWEGEILYDGKKGRELSRELMSRSVASVDQEIFLFAGTIRQNLTLWDPTAPEKNLIQACKDACIHDVIISREEGYDSLLIERGRNFSGGERQQLEIARALVANPTILILDEATADLDSETEKSVIDNIRRRGCTCIIIAHRLSTIKECDEILVLQQGEVIQRGDHQSLKDQAGFYQELVRRG